MHTEHKRAPPLQTQISLPHKIKSLMKIKIASATKSTANTYSSPKNKRFGGSGKFQFLGMRLMNKTLNL